MTQISNEEIKLKSQKVDEVYNNCMAKLRATKKKENEIINTFNRKVDGRKIEKVRKEIEGL